MKIVSSLLVALAALLPAAPALAQRTAAPYPLQLWKDPAFKKQFLGEYGVLTPLEPTLNDVERKQMTTLSEVMGEKPEESLKALEEVTTPQSTAEFDFVLGQLSHQTSKPAEKSIAHYSAAIAKFPSFRRAHYALGRVLVQDGKIDAGLKSLTKAMELGEADGTLFGLIGFCHLATDHASSAESAYRIALVLQPASLDWKMGLIRALLKQTKYDEVISLCDEMLAADPEKTDLWMLQSNAFIGKKDFLRAAGNLELVSRQGKSSAQDHMRLGDIYLNEQLADAARAAYARAVEHDTPLPLADAIRVVETLGSRGGLDQSKELLQTVRASYKETLTDPDRRRLMKIESRIAVAEGKGGRSVEILEEIVALDPLDGEALMLLAQHYGSNGEKERAALYYQRAEGIEAFEADASVKHAQLLAGTGKLDQAIPLLKRAQQLKPRESVAKYLEELERYQKLRR